MENGGAYRESHICVTRLVQGHDAARPGTCEDSPVKRVGEQRLTMQKVDFQEGVENDGMSYFQAGKSALACRYGFFDRFLARHVQVEVECAC